MVEIITTAEPHDDHIDVTFHVHFDDKHLFSVVIDVDTLVEALAVTAITSERLREEVTAKLN